MTTADVWHAGKSVAAGALTLALFIGLALRMIKDGKVVRLDEVSALRDICNEAKIEIGRDDSRWRTVMLIEMRFGHYDMFWPPILFFTTEEIAVFAPFVEKRLQFDASMGKEKDAANVALARFRKRMVKKGIWSNHLATAIADGCLPPPAVMARTRPTAPNQ